MNNFIKKYIIITLLTTTVVFAGDIRELSGLIFMHYSYEDAQNNEFAVKRAYLTYNNKFNDAISYKIQLDVGAGAASSYSVYLKTAKIDWETGIGHIVLGIQGMNMLKIQEKNWGYRFMEKAAMDRKGYSSSNDLGVGWYKQFGRLHTSVMITNGNGYKQAETDGHKKVSGRLHVGETKLKKSYNAGVVLSLEGIDYGADSTGSSVVMGGFGAVALGSLTMGGEYNIHTVQTDSKKTSTLAAAYAKFKLTQKLTTFARVDLYDDDNMAPDDSDSYFISGIIFKPENSLSIAPNIRVDKAEAGQLTHSYYVNFQFKF